MFLTPVPHESFFEKPFRSIYAHHSVIRHTFNSFANSVSVSIEAHPKTVLICFPHVCWSHANRTMTTVIVRVHHVRQHIDPSIGRFSSHISPQSCLDCPIEPFHTGCLHVTVAGKVFNVVLIHEFFELRVEKLQTFVCLETLGTAGVSLTKDVSKTSAHC